MTTIKTPQRAAPKAALLFFAALGLLYAYSHREAWLGALEGALGLSSSPRPVDEQASGPGTGGGSDTAPSASAAPAREASASEDELELVTASGVSRLNVEIARTPDQQALGLMFRTSLADDQGMLFPHEAPRVSTMWMRNTYIPLDMVFILEDGTIHRIEERTEPFSERIISSGVPVSAVLEIAGGAARRLGLKAGDKVRHPMFKAKG